MRSVQEMDRKCIINGNESQNGPKSRPKIQYEWVFSTQNYIKTVTIQEIQNNLNYEKRNKLNLCKKI